jgi:peptidoglycan/LPS O-acetylase OafA/YrhL
MNGYALSKVFDARNNSMNIMRLLTALAVIYGHASAVTGRGPGDIFLQYVGYKFIGGVAVDVFFVLSGFLITASVMSGNGIRYFIASRVLRIYPALIVCCVLSVFLLGSLLTISDQYWQSMDTWRYLLGNLLPTNKYFLPGARVA